MYPVSKQVIWFGCGLVYGIIGFDHYTRKVKQLDSR
jgi:hypothetical protein